ncbi:MAG: hypothetical protein ACKVPJ_06270 [Chitinophagales bacterium]
MKKFFRYLSLISFVTANNLLFAQGNVGIGTSIPAEKLDVNGAMIVTGAGVAATPIPGTIRWNSTGGYHEGRTSSGTWIKLQNDETVNTGDFTALLSTCVSPVTLGTFEASNPSTGYYLGTSPDNWSSSPFNTWWGGDRTQLLYRASELSAAGLCSGSITMIGFVINAPGVYSMANLNIYMKNSSTTSLTAYETGLTNVYSTSSFTAVVGNNDFTLSTPFNWDGTSNLVVEICWNNNIVAILSSCIVQIDQGYSFNTSLGYYADITPGICSSTTVYTTTSRPVTRIGGPVGTPTSGIDNYYQFNDPWRVGNPVLYYGADHHGPGTVTAEAIYDDNSLVSDYVFDNYFDGKIKEEDKKTSEDYQHRSLEELEKFVSTYRHLPTIPGRDAWEAKGTFSVGELLTDIWVSAEEQALYIKELDEEARALESLLRENKNLIHERLNKATEKIRSNPYLSTETKVKKISEIEESIRLLEKF